MVYKFAGRENYTDLAGGRVIYHRPGFTHYPARLAKEIFMRCLVQWGKGGKACVYDPCCGSGYILTVLGFLCGTHIQALYGSDISPEAVALAKQNLSLLTAEGLTDRQTHLHNLFERYGKPSHQEALDSAKRLKALLQNPAPICEVFCRDIWQSQNEPKADIVLADVPYGRMTVWAGGEASALDAALEGLRQNLNPGAIVALSSNKGQKRQKNSRTFKRLEKFQAGKRKIEILATH